MSQLTPPPILMTAPPRRRTLRNIILIYLVFFACLCCFVAGSMFSFLKDAFEIHYRSNTDTFHVTVLKVKSEPHYLMERVRVKCERGMRASIWVTDLKEFGLFKNTGTNGEVFYRDGYPHKAGASVPIHADGKYSTCDIFFQVSTTSSNTIWHDKVGGIATGGASGSTTLPTPLVVSNVQTNWPGSYERGSELSLASLGNYKILLSVK